MTHPLARARNLTSSALYLAHCQRAGGLETKRLQLAAFCGDRAACLVCDRGWRVLSFEAWLRTLHNNWGREVAIRAALAAARLALPRYHSQSISSEPLKAIAVAQAWLDNPCFAIAAGSEEAAGKAARVCSELRSSARLEARARGVSPAEALAGAYAAAAAAHTALAISAEDPWPHVRCAVKAARRALGSERWVWTEIREELREWSLTERAKAG